MAETLKSDEAKSEESKSKEADTKKSTSQSWWLTLPGLLTGVAAVITAVTGLVIGLHQIGALSSTEQASPEKPEAAVTAQNDSRPSPASSDTPTSQTPSGDDASQQSLALPAGMEVKVRACDSCPELVYKILSARLEPYNSEKRLLRFTVRLTVNARGTSGGANFWDRSFRLLVDDVPRAPFSNLNEIVEADSAKEGDVVFQVPTTENDVVLQIGEGDDKTEIPFDLTATET